MATMSDLAIDIDDTIAETLDTGTAHLAAYGCAIHAQRTGDTITITWHREADGRSGHTATSIADASNTIGAIITREEAA